MKRTGRCGNFSAAIAVPATHAAAASTAAILMTCMVSSWVTTTRLLRSVHVLQADGQPDRALELRRQVYRLGEHQPVVALARGCVLGRHAERNPVEPGIGFFAHGAAQLAERHIADRVAG